MANNTNKEKWINDVLGSMQDASAAQPFGNLYEGVMSRLRNPGQASTQPASMKQWVVAAILLLALNVGSVIYYTAQKRTAASIDNPLANEIQSVTTYNY